MMKSLVATALILSVAFAGSDSGSGGSNTEEQKCYDAVMTKIGDCEANTIDEASVLFNGWLYNLKGSQFQEFEGCEGMSFGKVDAWSEKDASKVQALKREIETCYNKVRDVEIKNRNDRLKQQRGQECYDAVFDALDTCSFDSALTNNLLKFWVSQGNKMEENITEQEMLAKIEYYSFERESPALREVCRYTDRQKGMTTWGLKNESKVQAMLPKFKACVEKLNQQITNAGPAMSNSGSSVAGPTNANSTNAGPAVSNSGDSGADGQRCYDAVMNKLANCAFLTPSAVYGISECANMDAVKMQTWDLAKAQAIARKITECAQKTTQSNVQNANQSASSALENANSMANSAYNNANSMTNSAYNPTVSVLRK